MFGVGVSVRVKVPFNISYPDIYIIEGQSVTGAWQIAGGIDFAEEHLEIV